MKNKVKKEDQVDQDNLDTVTDRVSDRKKDVLSIIGKTDILRDQLDTAIINNNIQKLNRKTNILLAINILMILLSPLFILFATQGIQGLVYIFRSLITSTLQ